MSSQEEDVPVLVEEQQQQQTDPVADEETLQAQAEETLKRMALSRKLTFAFNRTYIDFLKDVKSRNKDLGKTIKKHYKTIDKLSLDYMAFWTEQFSEDSGMWEDATVDLLGGSFANKEVFKSVTVQNIVDIVRPDERDIIIRYQLMLRLFQHLMQEFHETADETVEEVDGVSALLDNVLQAIRAIDHGESFSQYTFVDDTIQHIVDRISKLKVRLPQPTVEEDADADAKPSGTAFPSEIFENSKIGQLAKEISEQIDLSSLNISKPEDLMNIQGLLSGSNSALSTILQRVGSTITNKIQDGSLKQDDLLADAMKLMGKLDKGEFGIMGSLMKNMMGVMGGGAGGAFGGGGKADTESRRKGSRSSTSSVRDRLKKKVASRKNNAQ
jgi:hypothetical protein